jgi:hypothetical protein
MGQAQWLLIVWAYWIDGHRTTTVSSVATG